MNDFWKRLKKGSRTDFLILFLLGVMLMIVAIPSKKANTQELQADTQTSVQTAVTQEDYAEQLQTRLEKLLGEMAGVGTVRVMLTLADEGEDTLDKNRTSDEEKEEETTVIYDTGDAQTPYVLRRQTPKIKGVLVVAEGGGNAQTAAQIVDALTALFGIEAHQVTVVKLAAS